MSLPSRRPPFRALVLTDRFPPDTHGGAEISLADALAAIPAAEWEIRVIALTPDGAEGTDAAGVRRLRIGAAWPPGVREALRRGGPVGKLRGVLEYFMRGEPAGFGPPLGGITRRLRRIAGKAAPHLHRPAAAWQLREDEFAMDDPALSARIAAEIADFRPDILHADNKDAILLAATVPRGAEARIAFVRDHRFFCAHPVQSMMANGAACAACTLGCMPPMPWPAGAAIRAEMRAAPAMRRRALAQADRILCASAFMARQIEGFGLGRPVEAAPNPHPATAPAACAPAAHPPEFLFAGNLRAEKGPQILLAALPRLRDALGEVRLVFAGRGPLEAALRDGAAAMGAADAVELTGFLTRAQIEARLARAAAAVAPALWPEPFGRLPLEAAMHGRPCVATALGGYPETIRDGETGILVPPGDADALADALIALARDPARADAMGAAARADAAARHSPARAAAALTAAWRAAAPADAGET